MSVDTVKARRNAGSWFFVENTQVTTHIHMLCDEIDRLRKQNEELVQQNARIEVANRELAFEAEKLKKTIEFQRVSLTKDSEEYVKLREECDTLREQLRPRSIKGEPPPKDRAYLAFNGGAWRDRIFEPAPDDKAWLPMIPAPPQPDAFEEFKKMHKPDSFNEDRLKVCNSVVFVDAAKEIWNAAIQSTKHEKTNPVG